MKETVETDAVVVSKATALPKRKASEPFLIPWESNENGGLMMSITYLKGYFRGQDSLTKVKFDLDFEHSVFDNHYEFEVKVSNTEKYIVSISLTSAFMKVHCSCNDNKKGLCQHAYSLIKDRLRDNKFYFKHLYNEQWNYPNQQQRKLFKVLVANVFSRTPKVILEAVAGLGRIYSYPFDKSSPSLLDVRFHFEELAQNEKQKRLVFAIPIDNDINGLPLLMPFLSRDRRGNTFQSSYLFNENLPQPETLTSYELALDAVARQMLKISELSSLDVVSQDERWGRKQKLMNLWCDVIVNYLKNDDICFFESNRKNYDVAEIVLRNSSTNVYKKLKIGGEDFKINIRVIESLQGLLVEVLLYYKGVQVKSPKFLSSKHSFLMKIGNKTVLFIDDFYIEQVLNKFKHSDFKVFVLKQDIECFYEDIIKPLLERFPVQFSSFRPESDYMSTSSVEMLRILDLNVSDDYLHLEAKVAFGDIAVPILDYQNPQILWSCDNQLMVAKRNYNEELEFASFVASQHELFNDESTSHSWRLPLVSIAKTSWIERLKRSCRENQIKLNLDRIQLGSKYYPYEPKWKVRDVLTHGNFLHIQLSFNLGNLSLDLSGFERYLFDKKNWYIVNSDQYVYISDSLRSMFIPLFSQGRIEGEYLVLTSAQCLSFQAVLEKIDPSIINEGLRSRREKLENMKEIPLVSVPATIKATLRPYQLAGLSWMAFLQEFQWGGILADDMGLGKTLQVISLLEYYYERNPNSGPSIIIVPNSLLFNWQNEFQKFAPAREIVIYHGTKRKDISELGEGSVVLTTYGTAMADVLFLRNLVFSYMILDESQAVKNRNSKRFEYLYDLKSSYRIAMTGTPIENGIQDIYAQMTLVNPGFFGNYRAFNNAYKGIAQEESRDETLGSLQKMIQPFMLRRTKMQVALDLPDKMETTLLVDMLPAQRKVYDKYRKIYQGEVADNLNSADPSKSKFVAMEALNKLRQICNSPALLKDESFNSDSIKLDQIEEILSEVVPGHKVLLFSFFTSMLQLVEERVKAKEVGYAYLDGKLSQQQRQEAVERFQGDESCRVFLISLKAGGTGLNLTAADYVYILDPWWNPAVEVQAIDRCYRIGQEKHVNAYKIVCKDSVEEKILVLQEHKKQLADGLILDETNLMKTLSKEELLKLFD
ncbi:Helicase conserved C-terminal domain-containing protein [Sphingobacterium nematocida]|uniref:Helicase conserved C-terminal domain-containing protein n=1 Tax=Sphingobacterium nematocida TaxID=1513896 RepID=A0A1T5C6V3_9SPHI|nr:DEAD/DEAH box helicase [Sphingobacterium nematocida]SKB54860.1 Helicase conserved C-terminal domain-containing protein [Sphingobacterium nematocida]